MRLDFGIGGGLVLGGDGDFEEVFGVVYKYKISNANFVSTVYIDHSTIYFCSHCSYFYRVPVLNLQSRD